MQTHMWCIHMVMYLPIRDHNVIMIPFDISRLQVRLPKTVDLRVIHSTLLATFLGPLTRCERLKIINLPTILFSCDKVVAALYVHAGGRKSIDLVLSMCS